MAKIAIANLGKSFNGLRALETLSLEVEEGSAEFAELREKVWELLTGEV